MLLLISLAAAVLFTLLCGDILKKHPVPVYIAFTAAAVFFVVFPLKNASKLFVDYFAYLFTKGSLAAAFFVLVMFAGAFKAGSRGAKKLMPIRAELAIAASLLTITHLISYGFLYVKRLITGGISPTQATITYFAIPLVVLLIPLAVTSFKKIRKKMNPKKWKSLQRFAYAFYALLYIHVMIAYMPSAQHGKIKSVVNIIVYSAVFLAYAAMRLSKAIIKKHKNNERKIGLSLSAAGAAVFMAVTLIAVIPYANTKADMQIQTSKPAVSSEQTSSVGSLSSKKETEVTESRIAVFSKITDDISSKSSKNSSENSSAVVSSNVSSKVSSSVSSKTVSSQNTSSKSSAGRTSDTSSAVHETVQSENTSTEIEDKTDNSETEQVTSSGSIESETMSSNEEIVSEAEPEPEIIRIYNDGEYTAKCYEEDDDVRVMITVTIKLENDKIVDITVDSDETDTWYLDKVKESVIPLIVEREESSLDNFDDIDAVSGATLSSNGAKRAVKDALGQARINR